MTEDQRNPSAPCEPGAGQAEAAAQTARDLLSQAICAVQEGRVQEAEALFQSAAALLPAAPFVHLFLGNTLCLQRRYHDAAPCFERALSLDAGYVPALVGLGTIRLNEGQPDAALAYYQAALRESATPPEAAEAWFNIGCARQFQRRYAEALDAFEAALRHAPDHAPAHLNRGLLQLARTDFAEGWDGYEWRAVVDPSLVSQHPFPYWSGEPLGTRTLLAYAEQGFGDTIQFCRFLPRIPKEQGRVVLACPSGLFDLLSHNRHALRVDRVVRDDRKGRHGINADLQVALPSLPGLLRCAADEIGGRAAYLEAPPQHVAQWQRRIKERFPDPSLRVGVAWQGNPNQLQDAFRSLPVAQLGELFATGGVHFVGLNKETPPGGKPLPIPSLSPELESFADTAAAVRCLDLVISVDTAVAHLSGALGCPTWVLLPYAPDWRWIGDTAHSPWHPTARLFRQARPGDWPDVIRRVAGALADEARLRSQCGSA